MLDVKLSNFLGTDTSNYRPSGDPKDEVTSLSTKNISKGQSNVSLKDKDTGAKVEVSDVATSNGLKGQKQSNIPARGSSQRFAEVAHVKPKIRGDRVRGNNRRAPSEKVSFYMLLFCSIALILKLSIVKALNRYQLKPPVGVTSSKADHKNVENQAVDYKSFKYHERTIGDDGVDVIESDQKAYPQDHVMSKSFKDNISAPTANPNENYEEDFEEEYDEYDDQEEVVEEVYEVQNENENYVDYIEEPIDDTAGINNAEYQPEEKFEASLSRSQKEIRHDDAFLGKTVSTKRQYQNQVDIVEDQRFASSTTRRSDTLPSLEPTEMLPNDAETDLWKSVWKNRDSNEVEVPEEEEPTYEDGIEMDVSLSIFSFPIHNHNISFGITLDLGGVNS